MPSRPMAAGRHEPAVLLHPAEVPQEQSQHQKQHQSQQNRQELLEQALRALEAVTDRDSVERKKAMVSISKPTQRVARRAAK